MDGMFYRSESEGGVGHAQPSIGIARLLLITVVVAAAIVGGMLFLRWAGVDMVLPEEFPALSPSGG